MPRLLPIDEPAGPAFVEALRRVWDAGDAVLALDRRLPRPAQAAVLAAARPDEPVEPGDAVVMATSGSTGAPKAVVLTHDGLLASAVAGSEALGVDPTVDHWLACMPLSHMSGLGVVTRALLTGTTLTLHDGFDADAVDAAAAAGCTLTTFVPTALAWVDASRWRRIVVGGAPVPGGLPSNCVTSYGLTETAGGCVYDGRPFAGVDIRIDDQGQVLVRGPVLLRVYRDGTDPRDSGGWLPTGDAGHFDADGRLVIDGRVTDLIITGGENVWPAAVERSLRSHAAIAEVAVAGRPDAEWGERVVAFVIPSDPAAPPTLDALRDHVKAELPPWCAPRELVLVADLPRTRSGKVRAP